MVRSKNSVTLSLSKHAMLSLSKHASLSLSKRQSLTHRTENPFPLSLLFRVTSELLS